MENLNSYTKKELLFRVMNDKKLLEASGFLNERELFLYLDEKFIYTSDQKKILVKRLEVVK